MARTSFNKFKLAGKLGRNFSSLGKYGSSDSFASEEDSDDRYSRRSDERQPRRYDRDGGQGSNYNRSDRRERSSYSGNDSSPWGKSEASSDEPSERRERHVREVIDVSKVYESEVPLGRMVELDVTQISDKGAFVNAMEHGALFVPNSQLPENLQAGDTLRVFLYMDGDRVLATARRPYIELGMTGNLRINSVKNSTAYLDLGIAKELVMPVSEQRFRMYEGDNALVYVAIDERGRLFGTQCFNRYIRDTCYEGEFERDQRVKVVGVARTPLGYRVIVNDCVYGLIYASEQRGEFTIGKRYEGFIRTVREDGRLDVSLQETGREATEHAAEAIIKALYLSNGHFDFNDRTFSKEQEDQLQMSKTRFKRAVGSLYKQRLILIGDATLDLTEDGESYCKSHFAHLTEPSEEDIRSSEHEGADQYEGRDRDYGLSADRRSAERINNGGRKVFSSRNSDTGDYKGGNEDAAAAVFDELRNGSKFNKDRD